MIVDSKFQNYAIATSHNLYEYCDIPEEEEEKFREELWQEQMGVIEKEVTTENVIIHFLEDTAFCNEMYEYASKKEIDEYIQYLAIKDGLDLVRFENGNLGFIAYYNGHENGFEIIQTEENNI